MSTWLAHLLVFTCLVAAVTACATTTSDRPAPKEQSEQKAKPSEPFRY